MSFITLDFETFYDKQFSLSKMTTEEYIRDPQFEVIGFAIKVDDAPTRWYSGDRECLQNALDQFDWKNAALLCHNTMFDGAILKWIFGIEAGYYFDTLSMARAVHGLNAGGSLAALVTRYSLGEKGTEVINALGKHRADFSSEDLSRYAAYCRNDVDLTYKLFDVLSKGFPDVELNLINMTLRMYICPRLEVDDALLVNRLDEIKNEKTLLLIGLSEALGENTEEGVRKKLSSNPQFAEVLKQFGVEPPTKISTTTGKETFAFAKTDEGFIALQEHEDPFIQQLCAVRLGTKSTIEESRIQRFIDIGARNKGKLPIPLKYYGAHTGRWSGQDAVNLQNLPSRNKKKKALKNALRAPDGYYVINCDSSQIEARVLAWLAGQGDVIEAFAEKRDVYCEFASKVYRRTITKENPIERFVGKTCVAEGTLVLCDKGWKQIETVTTDDRVWDGEEWVCHSGVVSNGMKETLQIHGLWLTPDHQVWSGIWQSVDYLLQDADTLSRALGIGAANLPSQATWLAPEESVRSLSDVIADQTNTQSVLLTLRISDRLAATYVRSKQHLRNAIGNTLKLFRTMRIGLGCSTALPLPSLGVIPKLVSTSNTTGNVEFSYPKSGEKTALSFCDMSRHYQDGTIQNMKWIELMSMGHIPRVTFDLYRDQTTCEIKEKSLILKPVYDILNSGSKNRFTVLTNNGPLIVHNCVLGLGYGTGAEKLRHTLKTSPPGADIPIDDCKDMVRIYRTENDRVIALWEECDNALGDIASWPKDKKPYYLGAQKCVKVTPEGIQLPNGLYIRYPNLRKSEEGKWIYDSRRGVTGIWGGAVVENIVQALARIIVGEQMLDVNQVYPTVLTVHDAGVWVVPEGEIDSAEQYIIGYMSTPPVWCPDLPVACEAKHGRSYGDC
jgi:hypothetical protein